MIPRRLLMYLWLLAASPLAIALDIAVARGLNLVNNATQGAIIMNGIWYSRSNSTTDVNAMDPLIDAEACTRDAALMSQLGINTIYVMAIDPKENHNDCFSIFNSVGIYVMLVLRKDGIFSTSYDDFVKSYTTDFLKGMFEMIDAVKDYENLLGFDLGVFPDINEFVYKKGGVSYVDGEKMYRAFIRDVKEYIALNAPRSILVGGTMHLTRSDEGLEASDLSLSHSYWLSCAVDGDRDDFSRADYVAHYGLGYFETDPVGDQNYTYAMLEQSLRDSISPTWLSIYGVSDEADYVEYELRPELLNDTLYLYNSSSQLITPNGVFSGGARFTWTNANLGWKQPISNWGLVTTDSEGNVQLTKNYDRLREIFSDMNTENWLSGQSVGDESNFPIPACNKNDMVNQTTIMYMDEETTVTIATDWALPTRPSGMDALITSGVGGTRGQMVDVTITTIVHTVRDSDGNVVTSLALSPSKSESRTTTTTGSPTSSGDPGSKPGLSTGARAGIGAGAAIAGLALIGAGGFFFFRRYREKKAANSKDDENPLNDLDAKNGFHKAELATGDEVERKPAAELAARDGKSPNEAPAMEAGEGVFEMNAGFPVELPTHERTLELPAQSRGDEPHQGRRD